MQAFYVSKLKLESSVGYNLFALCTIQLIFYLGHFPWHITLYIDHSVHEKIEESGVYNDTFESKY